jgi:superfamily II DNA or RNA helicase
MKTANKECIMNGKADYSYQKDIVQKIMTSLGAEKCPSIVLAAGCGAGKTRMATEVIGLFRSEGRRVLVLTHGQKILRTQFAKSIAEAGLKANVVTTAADYDRTAGLVVALPHSLRHLSARQFGQFDLVVIDEAHQFYMTEAGMVEGLLRQAKPKRELLLTATPSPFVRANKEAKDAGQEAFYEIIALPQIDLIDYGVIVDPEIGLIRTSAYNYTAKDYSNDDQLLKGVRFGRKATHAVMKTVFASLPAIIGKEALSSDARVANHLGKIMVATASTAQARDVVTWLGKMKIKAVLSTAADDDKATQIAAFKQDPAIKVLVVVMRGVLGFDFPGMGAAIDLSGTLNPDRIFQFLNRVSRRDQTGRPKYFVKVVPEAVAPIASVALSCAVAMGTRQVLLHYTGLYRDLVVPVGSAGGGGEGGEGTGTKGSEDKKTRGGSGIYTRIPGFRLMDGLRKFQVKGPAADVNWVTFREARMKVLDIKFWDFNACLADALQYSTRKEWQTNSGSAYGATLRNGWLDECCQHMTRVWGKWDKAACKEDALQYSTRAEWKKNSSGAYKAACNNDWLDECCQHMEAHNWDKTACKEDALQYSTRGEWRKNSRSAYDAAWRNDWLDECCHHMEARNWDKTACKEDALQYSTRGEWAKNSNSAYQAAQRNGWLDECCQHMTRLLKSWDKAACKEDAKDYETHTEWYQHSRSAYRAARKNGWLDECCRHMRKGRPSNQVKTKAS